MCAQLFTQSSVASNPKPLARTGFCCSEGASSFFSFCAAAALLSCGSAVGGGDEASSDNGNAERSSTLSAALIDYPLTSKTQFGEGQNGLCTFLAFSLFFLRSFSASFFSRAASEIVVPLPFPCEGEQGAIRRRRFLSSSSCSLATKQEGETDFHVIINAPPRQFDPQPWGLARRPPKGRGRGSFFTAVVSCSLSDVNHRSLICEERGGLASEVPARRLGFFSWHWRASLVCANPKFACARAATVLSVSRSPQAAKRELQRC